jgi:hypothetical protein
VAEGPGADHIHNGYTKLREMRRGEDDTGGGYMGRETSEDGCAKVNPQVWKQCNKKLSYMYTLNGTS